MDTQATKNETTIAIGESISIVDNHLIFENEKISLLEITDIRYGLMPIRLEMFTIGSRYMLEVKTHDREFQANFRSYFGILKQAQYEKFNTLMNSLWDLTVVRLVNEMIDEINEGGAAEIGKCKITHEGIWCKNFLIQWNDLTYQKLYNRITINSKANSDIWTNLYFTKTDNVHILMYFLDWKFKRDS